MVLFFKLSLEKVDSRKVQVTLLVGNIMKIRPQNYKKMMPKNWSPVQRYKTKETYTKWACVKVVASTTISCLKLHINVLSP